MIFLMMILMIILMMILMMILMLMLILILILILMMKEWSDRGNGLETLKRRLREEGARLEKLLSAAEGEAGARGEDLARMMVEFETRAACAEAGMDQKVT